MERSTVWLWFLFALLLYFTYRIFAPFLVPLAWAGVLVICFYPVHRRIHERLRRPNLAALTTVLLLTLIIIVPTVLLAGTFASEAVEALGDFQRQVREGKLPGLARLGQMLPVEKVTTWLATHGKIAQEELHALILKNFERLAGFIASQTTRVARNVLVFVFQLFVIVFASFYLFRDGPRAVERFRGVLPLKERQRDRLLHTAENVLYASIYSGLVVAVVQGALGGVLFALLGIRAALFWGVVMGFFSLLPVVGAWVIWLPAAILFLLEGEIARGLILLVAGAAVVGMVDNFLRPVLISGRTRLNGLLVFISVLGGLVAFGLIGLVLGPIIVALGVAVLEAYTVAEEPLAEAPTASAQAS